LRDLPCFNKPELVVSKTPWYKTKRLEDIIKTDLPCYSEDTIIAWPDESGDPEQEIWSLLCSQQLNHSARTHSGNSSNCAEKAPFAMVVLSTQTQNTTLLVSCHGTSRVSS